ncbi:MAG TPA: class IV lanthionine synthetase LanL [Ktedonosporobacter sp.]|nr:class IV lanthionine synthetase LanL [Ktedonosporobacter sp.]
MLTVSGRTVDDEADIIAHIVTEMCGNEEMIARGWLMIKPSSREEAWITLCHQEAEKRRQGWKLHVSAAIPSLVDVLRHALPVLLGEHTCFKVIASLQWLKKLNNGGADLSQIGKCITVYPNDDQQAIRLAVQLDQATQGLRGPAIRSDRALRPGSLVHYRYGSFAERYSYTRSGTISPVIETPSGELIEDRRGLTFYAPPWVQDPFLMAGVSEAFASGSSSLLRGRYLPIAPMHQSARGIVYEAVDLQQGRRCVLKGAYRDAGLDHHFRDARDLLRNEAHILARLTTVQAVPRMYGLFEDSDELWLALEYIEGTAFNRYLQAIAERGETPSLPTLMAWIQELAEICDHIHQGQMVYRDLKAANVIVTPEGKLYLVDFGITRDLTSPEPQFHGGTRGYSSPQQIANESAAITDDIYSLGALLYFMTTGAEPTLAPGETTLLERSVAELNPRVPTLLSDLITRCLAPCPEHRYVSMQEVIAEAQAIKNTPVAAITYSAKEASTDQQKYYYQYARELSETLAVVVQTAIDGKGPAWAQLTPSASSKMVLRDLGNGLAGVLFVLATCIEQLHATHLCATLQDGAYWLLHSKRLDGPLLPGLLVGEAGIGAALLRAGQVLDDTTLLNLSEEHERLVVACPYDLPDFFHGTAGRIKYHLMLWKIVGDDSHLQAAITAGNVLVEQAKESKEGGLFWKVAQGYGELSEQVYPGYGHGVAGVADALLDLYLSTGRSEFLGTTQRAADWLIHQARVVGQDRQGLGWPKIEGGEICPAFWCHGSAGIGRFFLHAAQEQIFPQALDLTYSCARAVAEGTRWAGPSRCHGLAGSIELLLDLYELTGEQPWLHTAYTFAHLLEAFAAEQDGMRLWLSEEPGIMTPGFLTGYAGITATLLRLSTIESPMKHAFPRIL